MIQWQFYPKSDPLPEHLRQVIAVFEAVSPAIDSTGPAGMEALSSDQVLAIVRDPLLALGYRVEAGKRADEKVRVPVLFGRNGVVEKAFEADAYDPATGTVIEVEAGRAVVNNAVMKDLFEACMMHDVEWAVIAVRNLYQRARDFETVNAWFETLYVSRRLQLPLKGVLLIGY